MEKGLGLIHHAVSHKYHRTLSAQFSLSSPCTPLCTSSKHRRFSRGVSMQDTSVGSGCEKDRLRSFDAPQSRRPYNYRLQQLWLLGHPTKDTDAFHWDKSLLVERGNPSLKLWTAKTLQVKVYHQLPFSLLAHEIHQWCELIKWPNVLLRLRRMII